MPLTPVRREGHGFLVVLVYILPVHQNDEPERYGHVTHNPATEGAQRETPIERLLTQIEAQCRIARAAIADEREGDTRRAVTYIVGDALDLGEIVSDW